MERSEEYSEKAKKRGDGRNNDAHSSVGHEDLTHNWLVNVYVSGWHGKCDSGIHWLYAPLKSHSRSFCASYRKGCCDLSMLMCQCAREHVTLYTRCRVGICCQTFSYFDLLSINRSQWPAGSVMHLNNWDQWDRQREDAEQTAIF